MEELDKRLSELKSGLRSLQILQDEYDCVGWQLSAPPFNKYRHICLHLSALVGQFSALSEKLDHSAASGAPIHLSNHSDELEQLTSNITFHAAQIANLGHFDLYQALINRYSVNARRFAPDTPFATLDTR